MNLNTKQITKMESRKLKISEIGSDPVSIQLYTAMYAFINLAISATLVKKDGLLNVGCLS